MSRRIGVHLSTAGGPLNAVIRAREIGANTLQIFSSSPRMWRPATIDPVQAERMHEFRARYNITPLSIHTSYLLNVCSQTEVVREKSIAGLRGEIERGLALGAD
jgi:deoxyribonuclease IV